ncbi:MAG: thioester domain-containing protein, partial [Clostridia bacterium]|nr:thioester domain-containing protein [Clostridia bacterium]
SDVNTGITGYCIEHDTPANGRVEMTVYDWEKSPYWQKFDYQKRQLFKIALLYGYPNFNNSDLPDCDEYVATQCMIWEIEKGRNFRDDLLRSNSSKIAYQRLKDRMNEHSRVPSFDNKTVELKWDKNTKTYKGKITDTNNELKNFSISKVNGVTMKKNGNALEIESTRIIETPLRVNANKTTVPKAKSSKGMFLLEADDNQNCIFGNADDPVRSTFNIQTESVNMIKKISVNTGKFLSGATLELIRVSNGEIVEE